jgi:hypothetical protein
MILKYQTQLRLHYLSMKAKLGTCVRLEVFTAMTMKKAVFRDAAPCRSCVNLLSSETSVLIRSTRRHIPEGGIQHGTCPRRQMLNIH